MPGAAKDPRGTQPGGVSEGTGMQELHVHVPHGANMAGIARFYEQLMGAPAQIVADTATGLTSVRVTTSPQQQQLLIFTEQPQSVNVPPYSGWHISMFIADLDGTFQVSLPHERVTASAGAP